MIVTKTLGAVVAALVATLVLSACGDKDGGGPFGSGGVVGHYTLDMDAVRKEAAKEPKEKPGAEVFLKMIEAMKFDFDVNGDNTFTARTSGEFMGQKQESVAKGTWKQAGDQVTFTTTEEDGVKKDPPETKVATYKDGRLSLIEDRMPMVLKKK
jgi:hypothetical protein